MSDSNKDFNFDTYLEDLKNTPVPEEFNQEQVSNNLSNEELDKQLDELLFLMTLLTALSGGKVTFRKK